MKRPALTILASIVLLAGCSGGGGGTATTAAPPASPTTSAPASRTAAPSTSAPSTPSPSPTPAPTATETDQPDDATFSTAAQSDPTFPGGGGDLLPVGVRVGVHAGYERVVFDFEGSGTPGWRVQYVDTAIGDPSGLEIDVDGDATLEVVATGVRIPEESEYDRVLTGTVDAEGLDEVEEIVTNSIFEGHLQAFIGVDDQRPFRVFTLTNPSRLVIDLQTG
ncbi:MAG: hypothetical protein GX427_11800 [Actinomycetales bacterium]|nr:hypothetical protein [Actinomycetales bacterium]